jgi:hypothetical protein
LKLTRSFELVMMCDILAPRSGGLWEGKQQEIK